MTPTNVDFANRELSIDELEAIAAGWPSWVHSAVNWVKKEATDVVHWAESPSGKSEISAAGTVFGILRSIF